MHRRKLMATILALTFVMSACSSTEETTGQTSEATQTEAVVETTEAVETEETEETIAETEPAETEIPHTPENYEYSLVWEENFDGDELNTSDWNYEIHGSGWVNNELQNYGQFDDCVFVEDGDLVIQPVKEVDEDGKVTYRSGRVNTMRHHEFTYGRMEARIRTPHGRGYLPAFWMMPAREMTYGSWPRGGEIDIMEVVGAAEDSTYGTIHYGVPHNQTQFSYTLEDDALFSDDYHVYAVEWEPGSIKWFVDDVEIGCANDWFSASTETNDPREFPAPFNKDFYIILNVAVGGDWPGDPDETTPFDESAQMRVDYVRVYQRGWYDEDVQRPEQTYNFRQADENGNYVVEDAWDFYALEGGVGSMTYEDEVITVTTDDDGTVDYSIQLVQTGLPLEDGKTYEVAFEAYSEEERTMNVCVTGPDNGYVRYMEDTEVQLLPASMLWRTFTYTFTMNGNDDNGRLEFNMGNTGSTAEVYLRGVTISEVQ